MVSSTRVCRDTAGQRGSGAVERLVWVRLRRAAAPLPRCPAVLHALRHPLDLESALEPGAAEAALGGEEQ